MLESLGIGQDEEILYEALLRHGEMDEEELRRVGPGTSAALSSLLAEGLVRAAGDRYAAVPLDVALPGRIRELDQRLSAARRRVAELSATYRQAVSSMPVMPVEVLSGPWPGERYRTMRRLAEREIRQMSPAACDTPGSAAEAPVRAIHAVLPGSPAGEGDSTRVAQAVPLTIVLIDDVLALLPATAGAALPDGMLVIRPGALLDAYSALFELAWADATPVDPGADASAPLTELLSQGLSDQAVARQLGVGLRTVQRRVQELMRTLHAATRFQAGVAVGRSRRPPVTRNAGRTPGTRSG